MTRSREHERPDPRNQTESDPGTVPTATVATASHSAEARARRSAGRTSRSASATYRSDGGVGLADLTHVVERTPVSFVSLL